MRYTMAGSNPSFNKSDSRSSIQETLPSAGSASETGRFRRRFRERQIVREVPSERKSRPGRRLSQD